MKTLTSNKKNFNKVLENLLIQRRNKIKFNSCLLKILLMM